jgi:predicted DNA-binding transcriptional regulator YafY
MYSGEPTSVTLETTSDLLDVIFDKFGEKTKITDIGNGKIQFTAEIQISNMFLGWCSSFGTKMKIIAPTAIKEQYQTYLQEIIENYSEGRK